MLMPPTAEQGRRLRDFFAAAKYTQEHFQHTAALREIPIEVRTAPPQVDLPPERSVLSVLLRWFFKGLPQSTSAVAEFIPPDILRILLDCGLLRQSGEALTPTVMLTPCDEFYFAADPVLRMRSAESGSTVLWPNPTTRLLQLFGVQKHSRATLDLGAGCGILGILAARFTERVTATDLNPRAAEFTRFNAGLNGVDSIECLTGDTFEPVAGRTFDLILANPPFFVTPTSGQMYCENEMDLDNYCRRVIREASQHLSEGGFFQAVMEWVQVAGQTWQERLSEWLEGSGCDAWVLRSYIRDAAGYARERIRDTLPHESYAEKMDSWMEYYRQRGVEEVHGGILAMRRRSGRNWLRLEGTPVEATTPFGNLVLDTFATQDILNGQPDDAALLAVRPRLPEGAQLDQRFRIQGRAWASATLHLVLTGAAPANSAVEPDVAGFLARCDGASTLRELADELAANVHVRIEDARAQCCRIVRTLASRRILQLDRD